MKFCPVVKDRLYYDQWQYSVKFYLEEASVLRDLDHDMIDDIIEARRKWRQIRQQRWQTKSSILASVLSKSDISDTCVKNLHNLADVLINSKYKFKSVVSLNTMWVYSNDVPFLAEIGSLPYLTDHVFAEAVVSRPRNTVILKNPTHTHRSYFRHSKLNALEKQQLSNFLKNSQATVRISPGMLPWLDSAFLRTQDYFFVDYNEPTWLTMLNLVHPGLIRKTLQIQQAK
jgi:hypothetical protein